jgi:beta-glucosidase
MPVTDPTASLAYQNPALVPEQRAADLVARLTLAEKAAQMVHVAPAIPRLGVPAYNWWNECLHGVARAGIATVFPQAIGLAATWDLDLIGRVARTISDEARAKHHEALRRGVRQIYTGLTFWSPNVNIFRDPRWGRGQETYGEDPYLTGRMGVTFVQGLQGSDPHYLKLVATPKHFAVHSGSEANRHRFNAVVSERDLWETYLPAFQASVVEGRAASVMGAYNRTLDEACCASQLLLAQILREEWGFAGYVVSDCGAIADIYEPPPAGHGLVQTPQAAAALSVTAGCDLFCCLPDCGMSDQPIERAVAEWLLPEALVDQAVTRLFAARFRLGMFDEPAQVPYAQLPCTLNDAPPHRDLARQAARESIVLLKNDAGLLPLPKDMRTIAVMGPNANDVDVLLGNYRGSTSHAVTLLDGIRQKLGPGSPGLAAQGCPLAQGVPVLTVVPSACLRPLAGSPGQHGLTGHYYRDAARLGGPALVQVDPVIDFHWWAAGPLGDYPTDPFAGRWQGTLHPPLSGRYHLGVMGSTSFRLLLDGREIVAGGPNEHEAFTLTQEVPLVAGRPYAITLEYANEGRDPRVQLLWSLPDQDYLSEALAVAGRAEAVVLALGLSPRLEGEEMPVQVPGFDRGDRTEITLPEPQQRLLESVVALGKPTVLVLLSGSAVAIPWAAAHVPAIVQAWYPGEEGGAALADVLFGDYNPAGRLPVTIYRDLEQLPPFEDYAMNGRTYRYLAQPPLYPFGHGLSYTRFAYSSLRIEPGAIPQAGQATIRVDVTNTGDRAGDEVVQLYVAYPHSRVPRPIKDLRGFARLSLAPGATREVTFDLPAAALRYRDHDRWVIEPGNVEVQVGASSDDIRLRGDLVVEA